MIWCLVHQQKCNIGKILAPAMVLLLAVTCLSSDMARLELLSRVATGGVGEVMSFVDVAQASATDTEDELDITSSLTMVMMKWLLQCQPVVRYNWTHCHGVSCSHLA